MDLQITISHFKDLIEDGVHFIWIYDAKHVIKFCILTFEPIDIEEAYDLGEYDHVYSRISIGAEYVLEQYKIRKPPYLSCNTIDDLWDSIVDIFGRDKRPRGREYFTRKNWKVRTFCL